MLEVNLEFQGGVTASAISGHEIATQIMLLTGYPIQGSIVQENNLVLRIATEDQSDVTRQKIASCLENFDNIKLLS